MAARAQADAMSEKLQNQQAEIDELKTALNALLKGKKGAQ
jgi:hypothetical protein